MKGSLLFQSLLATAVFLFPVPAFAHLDPLQHGSFAAGLSHPLSGADHILAMLAVGLWAWLLAAKRKDRRPLWFVPAAFVATMMAGFVGSMAGLPLPFVEPVILASVVVVGLLAAAALDVRTPAAMALVAFFALFHGHAHGGELGAATPLSFLIGFAVATALLHAAGISIGRVLGDRGVLAARLAGAATALAGVWLAVGA